MQKKPTIKFLAAALACTLLVGCTSETNQPEPNQKEYPLDRSVSAVMTIDPSVAITQNGNNPFTLFDENGDIVVQGTFITADEYNECVSVIQSQNGEDGLEIIEQDFDSGVGDYTLYKYDSALDPTQPDSTEDFIEYDYIARISNSNYGIMLGGTREQAVIEEAFDALNIKIIDTSA